MFNKLYNIDKLLPFFEDTRRIEDDYIIIKKLIFTDKNCNDFYLNQKEFIIVLYKNSEEIKNYFIKKVNWRLHANTILKELIILKKIEEDKKREHINIIKLQDYFRDAYNTRYFCIVLEYAEKGDLYHIIHENGKLIEDDSTNFFCQLIEGIYYLHSQYIAHLDIKPENIVITKDNVLKICDFNLSVLFENPNNNKLDITQLYIKKVVGSLRYIAPEIFDCIKTGNPYNPFFADVWSCGIVFYIMLMGHFPFKGNTIDEVFQNIKNKQYEKTLQSSNFISDKSKDLIYYILQIDILIRPNICDIKHKIISYYDDIQN